MQDIDALRNEILNSITQAGDLDALEQLRIAELGKKGRISGLMKSLGGMTPEERQTAGPALNGLKNDVADAIQAAKDMREEAALDARLQQETIDITLPVLPEGKGTLHPISQVLDEITEIFAEMGFTVAEGPDIENDFYNFTALNIPAEHPARQMHDTFYFDEDENGERVYLSEQETLAARENVQSKVEEYCSP